MDMERDDAWAVLHILAFARSYERVEVHAPESTVKVVRVKVFEVFMGGMGGTTMPMS